MLKLKALDVATNLGLTGTQFNASNTWIKLFLRRHKLSLRSRTRQGQTTPADAAEALADFQQELRGLMVENNCVKVFNADQTAVFFEHLPRKTISTRGQKTVWVKCANKDKERATAMLLGDAEGNKYPPFIMFKTTPAKSPDKQATNDRLQHGFGDRIWPVIKQLIDETSCQIYGNQTAWWNSRMSLLFLKHHFGQREDMDERILLLWDDFSGHWTTEVKEYAASINVLLMKVPPKYTYVCQPADVAWIKPFKGRLRERWVGHMRSQIREYEAGAIVRARKRTDIENQIAKEQMEQRQDVAAQRVAALKKKLARDVFKLAPPKRIDIVKWIDECWGQISRDIIIHGFIKVGLRLDDRQHAPPDPDVADMGEIVDTLAKMQLVGLVIDSDDDIGSDGESSNSESERETDPDAPNHSPRNAAVI